MSAQDWEKLEKNLGTIGQMAGLLKLVIGAGVAVVMSISALVIWVNQTTNGLAATSEGLRDLEKARHETLSEWGKWRTAKDEIDHKLAAITETQAKLIETNARRIERVEDRR